MAIRSLSLLEDDLFFLLFVFDADSSEPVSLAFFDEFSAAAAAAAADLAISRFSMKNADAFLDNIILFVFVFV
jgi:hypothetical protein